jgi:hypoxanthine phosphoribosyltransferase
VNRKKAIKVRERFSRRKIANRVARLGEAIRKDADKREVFLIGILNGTTVFLGDLLRAIPGEVSFAFIDETRDMSDTAVPKAMEIDFMSHVDIAGRNVYLIKDVVSTGIIETYLLEQLGQHSPAALKLVALLDRRGQRTVDLEVDYTLFKVEKGSYVGYGMELGGRFANLPYIGTIAKR